MQSRLLTFVVIGAGPTGVRCRSDRRTVPAHAGKDFRRIDPSKARIVLVDGADAVLGSFGPKLSTYAAKHLAEMGVEVLLGQMVVDVERGWCCRTRPSTAPGSNRCARCGPPGVRLPAGQAIGPAVRGQVDRAGR